MTSKQTAKWKWIMWIGLAMVLIGGGWYLQHEAFARGFDIGYDSGHSNANEEMANQEGRE